MRRSIFGSLVRAIVHEVTRTKTELTPEPEVHENDALHKVELEGFAPSLMMKCLLEHSGEASCLSPPNHGLRPIEMD